VCARRRTSGTARSLRFLHELRCRSKVEYAACLLVYSAKTGVYYVARAGLNNICCAGVSGVSPSKRKCQLTIHIIIIIITSWDKSLLLSKCIDWSTFSGIHHLVTLSIQISELGVFRGRQSGFFTRQNCFLHKCALIKRRVRIFIQTFLYTVLAFLYLYLYNYVTFQ
jgi:hypothetical protein